MCSAVLPTSTCSPSRNITWSFSNCVRIATIGNEPDVVFAESDEERMSGDVSLEIFAIHGGPPVVRCGTASCMKIAATAHFSVSSRLRAQSRPRLQLQSHPFSFVVAMVAISVVRPAAAFSMLGNVGVSRVGDCTPVAQGCASVAQPRAAPRPKDGQPLPTGVEPLARIRLMFISDKSQRTMRRWKSEKQLTGILKWKL